MTDKTSRLFNHVSTTRDFLLAKTDAACLGTSSSHRDGRKMPDTVPKALSEVFQDLFTGRRFMEHAMSILSAAEVFSACAIRISSPPPASQQDGPSPDLMVAEAIDTACRQENGIWGMIDQDLFGCFFPDKPEAFCEKAAALIRSGLPEANRPPVIIGTAAYPAFSFTKDQIIENACKAVDHACFFGPDSTMAFDDVSVNICGDKIFQSGDIHTAVAEYKTALEINDRNINIRNSLGVCYGLLGRLDLAKQEFAAAVCCNGHEVMALYNLGLVHLLLGDREKALDYFQKAHKLRDDIFEVTFQTGRLLLEMGDTDACLPYLNQSIELNPSSAQAFRAIGDYYLYRDQLSDAVSAYKKAVKLNPNDAAALSALGAVYDLRNENTEIATLYCEKSVQLAPEDGLFHLRLGKLYLKQDRVDEAQRAYKTAADLGQNNSVLLQDDGRPQKAC